MSEPPGSRLFAHRSSGCRWVADGRVPAAVTRRLRAAGGGDEPAEDWVALVDAVPIGIVQYCHFGDYPEYLEEMADVYPVGDGAVSIDSLVGEPDRVGRGVGTDMIRAFVDRIWATDARATHVVVPVNSANERSWRALLRADFRLVARGELEPDSPSHEPMHEILRIDRPDAAPANRDQRAPAS